VCRRHQGGHGGDFLGFEPNACLVDLAAEGAVGCSLGYLVHLVTVVYDLAGTESTGVRLLAADVAAGDESVRCIESDEPIAVAFVEMVWCAVLEASCFISFIFGH
jgi:hypothetical protein